MHLTITTASKVRKIHKFIQTSYLKFQIISQNIHQKTVHTENLSCLAIWFTDKPQNYIKAMKIKNSEQDIFIGFDFTNLEANENNSAEKYIVDRINSAITKASINDTTKLAIKDALVEYLEEIKSEPA